MANLSGDESQQGLALRFTVNALPLLPGTEEYAKAGLVTGGGRRNEEYYGGFVAFQSELPRWQTEILYDPQTSGPLLFTVAPSKYDDRWGAELRELGGVVIGRVGLARGPEVANVTVDCRSL